MNLCLFEDGQEQFLAPLTLTRPVFELVCGRFSLRERLVRAWNVTEWGVILRPHLTGVYRETHPEARINDPEWLFDQPVLMVNGRWIPDDFATFPCMPKEAVLAHKRPVALWVLPDEWKRYGHLDQTSFLDRVASTRTAVEVDGTLLSRPWDLIAANAAQLRRDYRLATLYPQPVRRKGLEILGDERELSVSPRTEIEPFVVLDARRGPITIDDGVKIQAFCRIEGPCHLGRDTRILGGRIASGTTIGPQCRIAGDVENSILHSQVNKCHKGFLGHSYVCPWGDFGAGTSANDRNPDETSVTVPGDEESIDSGLLQLGSLIGDFVRTSANTLFEPGSTVGPMSLVQSAGRVAVRRIPAFSRYSRGTIDRTWPLESQFELARSGMGDRQREFTAAEEMLFRLLFDQQSHSAELAAPGNERSAA